MFFKQPSPDELGDYIRDQARRGHDHARVSADTKREANDLLSAARNLGYDDAEILEYTGQTYGETGEYGGDPYYEVWIHDIES
jgi:hypothetical protein